MRANKRAQVVLPRSCFFTCPLSQAGQEKEGRREPRRVN
jgi:hypothetical protein